MENALREKKQAVVRQALYDAAIDLFAQAGFDETTIEEVAEAAGVSRRTFFRYFESKDDLLAHSIMNYTQTLATAVKACPSGFSPVQVLTETVMAAARLTEGFEARTRQVIKISERSASARQAYQSRMADVEDGLARALATRFHDASPMEVRPRLLASIILTVMNTAIVAWFRGHYQNPTIAAQEVLRQLSATFSEEQPAKRPAGNLLGMGQKPSKTASPSKKPASRRQ